MGAWWSWQCSRAVCAAWGTAALRIGDVGLHHRYGGAGVRDGHHRGNGYRHLRDAVSTVEMADTQASPWGREDSLGLDLMPITAIESEKLSSPPVQLAQSFVIGRVQTHHHGGACCFLDSFHDRACHHVGPRAYHRVLL